jgi:hypothetical protein
VDDAAGEWFLDSVERGVGFVDVAHVVDVLERVVAVVERTHVVVVTLGCRAAVDDAEERRGCDGGRRSGWKSWAGGRAAARCCRGWLRAPGAAGTSVTHKYTYLYTLTHCIMHKLAQHSA